MKKIFFLVACVATFATAQTVSAKITKQQADAFITQGKKMGVIITMTPPKQHGDTVWSMTYKFQNYVLKNERMQNTVKNTAFYKALDSFGKKEGWKETGYDDTSAAITYGVTGGTCRMNMREAMDIKNVLTISSAKNKLEFTAIDKESLSIPMHEAYSFTDTHAIVTLTMPNYSKTLDLVEQSTGVKWE